MELVESILKTAALTSLLTYLICRLIKLIAFIILIVGGVCKGRAYVKSVIITNQILKSFEIITVLTGTYHLTKPIKELKPNERNKEILRADLGDISSIVRLAYYNVYCDIKIVKT